MKRIALSPHEKNNTCVEEVKNTILRGGVVALPAETVYGLAALPTNKHAVDKLIKIKQRDLTKPFTLHFAHVKDALNAVSILPPYVYRLIEQFWPGPLTIVSYAPSGEKIGVRVPDHKLLKHILDKVGEPIYLPSANRNGEKEAMSADEVESYFGESLDLIIDGGAPTFFKSSTVIDDTYHPFKIIREGVISVRDILDIYIRKRLLFVCSGNTCRSVMAEYLLKKYLQEYYPHLAARYEIISRGTAASTGARATPQAQTLLKDDEGIVGIDDHRAQQLNQQMILSSDLIFAMEDVHRDIIVGMEPVAESRIFLLKKFLPEEFEHDIVDPINTSDDVYKRVFEIIKMAAMELKDWL